MYMISFYQHWGRNPTRGHLKCLVIAKNNFQTKFKLQHNQVNYKPLYL